jgi:MoaA/NifB/PqqE/SkfB family radical SAM enzyme
LFSPDAGSEDVYKRIKGYDFFNRVWENIEKYLKNAGDNQKKIEVKFIIMPENKDDIENMLKMCLKAGVKNAVLDWNNYAPPDLYREYTDTFNKFRYLFRANGITVRDGTFVPDELREVNDS